MAKKKAKKRTSQTMLPEHESSRIDVLESAAKSLLVAKNKKKAAASAFSEAYQLAKNRMGKEGLNFYSCMDCNFDLIVEPRDEEVKLRERKVKD